MVRLYIDSLLSLLFVWYSSCSHGRPEIINASHSMRMAGEYDDDILRIRDQDYRKREVRCVLQVSCLPFRVRVSQTVPTQHWFTFINSVHKLYSKDQHRLYRHLWTNLAEETDKTLKVYTLQLGHFDLLPTCSR